MTQSLTLSDEQMSEVVFMALKRDIAMLENDITEIKERLLRGDQLKDAEKSDYEDFLDWYGSAVKLIRFYAKPDSKYWRYERLFD